MAGEKKDQPQAEYDPLKILGVFDSLMENPAEGKKIDEVKPLPLPPLPPVTGGSPAEEKPSMEDLALVISSFDKDIEEIQADMINVCKGIDKLIEFNNIDHERLARVESMIAFFLQHASATVSVKSITDPLGKSQTMQVKLYDLWAQAWNNQANQIKGGSND